jgi:hypothetical protein
MAGSTGPGSTGPGSTGPGRYGRGLIWGVIGPAKADAAMETVAMTLATETVVLNILCLLK